MSENKNTKEILESSQEVDTAEQVTDQKPDNKSKKKKGTRFYKKPGFKFSAGATILSVVFIVCIVALNILATFVADRVSFFDFDLTSSGDYSISEENAKYIAKIDRPVTITVTCTEDYYINDYYNYVSQYYADSTGGKYFEQTVKLLKEYAKSNGNITLKFVDSETPEFSATAAKYTSESFEPGMLLIECSFKNSAGKQQEKYKLLSLTDLYETSTDNSADSYYGTTYITGSAVESSVTSALFYVTSEQQDKATLVTGYGCSALTSYRTTLEKNNYDFEEISSLTLNDIPADTDLLIIAAPTIDMSANDIKKIDNFLLQSGYGKSLLYFASENQSDLKNLNRLLSEWGYSFGDGIVYETDENKCVPSNPTMMFLADAGSEYTKNTDASYLYFIGDTMLPMTYNTEQSGKIYKTAILNSNESTTVMPMDASGEWAPAANSTKKAYSALAMSTYATEDPENSSGALTSNMIVASSLKFVTGELVSYSDVANTTLLLNVINSSIGRAEDSYTVQNKVIDTSTFTSTESASSAIYYICVYAIPILVIAAGVVIYVRRKRR